MTSQPWLVVIDAQRIFADPGSEWCAPRFAETLDPIRELVAEHGEGERVVQLPYTVSEPSFGKWGERLREVVGADAHLVLAGVATDCCVLSTALAASDAGCTVEIAAAACAGSDDEAHERALATMELYAPQITIRR